MFTYYVWDLSYPKQYQILGFIQEWVFTDKENKFLKYTVFRQTFDDLSISQYKPAAKEVAFHVRENN